MTNPARKRKRRRTFLREWRKHAGLSQEAACEHLGMSQPNLSKIERGDLPYDQDLLEAAAALYRCSESDLLYVDPSRATPLRSALAELASAPEPLQRQAISVIAALLKTH